MSLGSPITNKFSIGTAELRIGPLASANKLLDSHSVGLIDQATVNITQESVDLEGGFPKKLVDTAIVRQTAELTATLREYSRANLSIQLGRGIAAAAVDYATTVDDVTLSAGAVVINVPTGEGVNFTAGDLVTTYPVGSPEKVSVMLVASVATDAVTFDAGTPTLHDYVQGDPMFLSHQLPIGDIDQTNYFAVMLVTKENSSGRPVVWSFWKGAIASGLEVGNNAEDFASNEITLKLLEPSAAEIGGGGDLNHLAAIIPSHPIGLYAAGGDS
jgi:hypothetical protein